MAIDYKNEYFQPTDYDLEQIIKELMLWFSEKKSLLDHITLLDNFTFTVVKVNTSHKKILAVGNFNSINIDNRRIESSNSEFYKKIDKYAELIEYTRMPSIISQNLDPDNGMDTDNVYSFLYGKSVYNNIINSEYTDHISGLFYDNINAKKYLSGVMLKHHKAYTFFYNYSKENKLNIANRYFFEKFKYK
ncbi:hypothetical protein OKW21_006141 [Catalinimonas alkaloidigena]|uniref:hypothetical protein n=1 Tax=Catalinimonas alkaloidigena TaxID=1075417 RepID=UPI002405EBDA|nr:hypothetical protein [Catalinimonas alkaloidigena]MDF9800878.1 hypothetical protein [Catalinimonas alkaloidigena]